MRPIPVAFHVWFIEVHTYGIGLALTFWFGLRYFERRLRHNGYPTEWVTGMFIWVIVAAIVGARVVSVLPNLSQYRSDPMQVFAIWQGGLSSFGGLIFAIPVGIIVSRRRCPEISTVRLLDLIAPVLMAAWGIGRLLGPQLMVRGGGHPTTAWFGMYYAGEVGRRLPVPIFQAIGDFTIFGILLLVERWLRSQAPSELAADGGGAATGATVSARSLPPAGIVIGVGMVLWGIERFFDEYLWLTDPSHLGFILVETAGIALSVAGLIVLVTRVRPFQRWRAGEMDVGGSPGATEDSEGAAGSGEAGGAGPAVQPVPAAASGGPAGSDAETAR
ncbi:MAG TPA: prolipoprotein diacylglyceryl transferase [Acidimicrobiales bacterium]|jgi:phosphatidylglycerol:prolipoprotein diacylglycerol transferase|nr:prolipoprotein diacylglyceryl transferase [Acidimicrobiales bacterium]